MAMMASAQTGNQTGNTSRFSGDESMTGGRGAGSNRVSNDDASSIDDHVNQKAPPEEKLNRTQKIRRHCTKWWWVYLIIGIVLLAILLPLLFTVIIPAIVQSIVNSQDLPVKSGGIYPISTEQALLSLKSIINTNIPAYVQDFTLDLYNADTEPYSPFLNISFPGQKISKNTALEVTNQTVTVTNGTELVKWFNRTFVQETVELSVKATPNLPVDLGALHYHPHLTKTISLPGLNYLQGIAASDLKIMIPPAEDGHNLEGVLSIPNAGVLTLGLYDSDFNLQSDDLKIGIISLKNAVLKPGNNTMKFTGKLYLSELIANLGTVLAYQGPFLDKGVLQLLATGNQTTKDGVHIKYFEETLNTKRIPLEIGVVTLLGDLVEAILGSKPGALNGLLGEVVGNKTLITQALDNFKNSPSGMSQSASNGTANAKRSSDLKTSLMWNMLRLSMKRAAK